MASINTNRLLIAGMAAGVVLFITDGLINGGLLADQWSTYQRSIGKSGEFSTTQMTIFGVIDLIAGLVLAWVYAAIRPRFGAGPATGLRAGLVVWLILNISSAFLVASNALPANLVGMAAGFGLIQYLAVGMLAGYLYKEEGAPAPRRSAARA